MEKHYKYIIDNSRDFITLINRDYVYELVNDTYCNGIEKNKEEIIGYSVEEVWGKDKFNHTIKGYIDRCFKGEHISYVEEFNFGPFLKYMHVSYYPYYENDKISHVVVFSHDISHIGRLENKLNHYEYRDPVTGLFNRRSLEIILDRELDRVQRTEGEILGVLLFVQIKNLENIIEMHGREVGDLLLENTGVRLQSEIRTSDYVFHFDGRQFAVLLSKIDNKIDAGNAAKKIFDTVTFPYNFKDHDIMVNCSIGAAVYPNDGDEKEELIQKALSAMLESERNNKWFTLYDENLYSQALRRVEIESAAYRAIEDKRFKLKFQPIVDLNFRIVGAEALLRWEHPKLGYISPMEFIPLAEQSDLIFSIGKWIMFSVCQNLAKWGRQYGIYISLNLSSREFSSPHLINNVKSALKNSPSFPPQFLKIEITENESIKNIEESVYRIYTLKQLGVDVFIDDFGTGNSSLQYLKKLPAQVLKIDREFVKDIEKNREDRDFLNTIVNMAHIRGKKILIEGVENKQQADLLVKMGCKRMQGFYFSKPLDPEDFETLLKNNVPLPVHNPLHKYAFSTEGLSKIEDF